MIKASAVAGAAAWTAPVIVDSLASPAAAATCVPCGPSGAGGIGGSGGYPSSPVCNIDSPDGSRTWYVFKIQNTTCSSKGGNVLSTCNVAVSQTFGGGEIHAGSDDCQPTLTPCSATGGCQITMPNCSSHNISFLQMIICCS
jgi:hypothetical protein